MAGGPLNGVRVLEFSIILSAPFAGLHLSDMGADVIKVEQPPLGDSMRDILPGGIPGQSKFFQVLNRGRRGLSVDLATERGKELIYRLVPSTDVVLINYRPGVAERLGVDYETLRRYRDDLIYADISGYGFEGPLRDHAASDIAASAYGGAIAFTDAYEEDGAPRANYPPLAGDTPTGLATAMGIVAALFHGERTGEGQAVRSSLLRSVMMMTCYLNNTDPVADPGGRDIARAALSRVREQGGSYQELVEARRLRQPNLYFTTYRTRDGGLSLGALTPLNRAAIRTALGLAGDDQDDPSFDPGTVQGLEMLTRCKEEIRELLLTRTVAGWIERLHAAGAPASPVNFPEELPDDPQAGLHYVAVEHPLSGRTLQVAPMVVLPSPAAVRRPAPALGAHNAELAREAGFSPAQIEELTAAGVLGATH